MNISLNWLNRYLSPAGVTAEEAEHVLTFAGYPVEGIDKLPSGDFLLDVELTSNRGDLLSHVGCAREIAAATSAYAKRELKLPECDDLANPGAPISGDLKLVNHEPTACPLFTAHLIRGVKVGPSPKWLAELLEAVGQRSINNLVDITNFITFELGNPCHVFDLKKLTGGELHIRYARDGESLTTLDSKTHKLVHTDLVVADAEKPTSLAGVMGGQASEVDSSTTDVVFEMATWAPVAVRNAARRLNIRTDASHRFERIVDARTIDQAARRAVAMIVELAGGQPAEGVLSEGQALPKSRTITVRVNRTNTMLGLNLSEMDIQSHLEAHEVKVERKAEGELVCQPPAYRPDLEREIDLIEEVARTVGYEHVPEHDKIPLRVRHPQESERARRELHRVLTGLGFYETVTFSFVSPEMAAPWVRPGLEMVGVDDDRRGSEPILRPSVLPSLLTCRRANAAGQVEVPGGVRLYEMSATFAQTQAHETVERRMLAMLMDVEGVQPGKQAKPEQLQSAIRAIRGAVEHIVRAMAGTDADLVIEPIEPESPGWRSGACGHVLVNSNAVGVLGAIEPGVAKAAGVDVPTVAAELDLDALIRLYPPKASVTALPEFPAIERDLSLIVEEGDSWGRVESLVDGLKLEHFESLGFIGAYRGKQVGEGKKSLTLRLRFRSGSGTLRHEDVDPQMERVIASAKGELGAALRT